MAVACRGSSLKAVVVVMLSLVVLCAATIFLVVAVMIGIERSEMMVAAASRRVDDGLRRAQNITLGCFIAAEVAACWLASKSGVSFFPRWHWVLRSLTLFLGLSMLSCVAAVLFVNLGVVPDIAVELHRHVSELVSHAVH